MVTPSAENLPTVKPTSAVNESDKISLGYDSEYTTYERDDVRSARGEDVEEVRRTYQNPITAQFALEGDFRGVQHPDLIYEVCERQKTAWVFRTPEEKMMGGKFLRWQENCLMSIFERIGLDREKAMTLDLWAFYSNAEIANFSPNHQYLKEVFEAVGEKAKLMPIQSSGIFLDIGIDLPEKWTLNIRDNRLICAAKSLKTLGESLGYPKGDLDFEKHNARWYLENERERFLDYAVRDAMIPLAWLEQFEESKAMAVEGLESSGIISKKSAEKILAKTYNTAAALTDDLMDGKLARDGKKEKYHQTVNHLIDEVIPRKFTSQNKGGFNRSSHGDRPKFFQNCDARDIRSAYLNAMMISDQPIVKPTKNLIFNDGKGEGSMKG